MNEMVYFFLFRASGRFFFALILSLSLPLSVYAVAVAAVIALSARLKCICANESAMFLLLLVCVCIFFVYEVLFWIFNICICYGCANVWNAPTTCCFLWNNGIALGRYIILHIPAFSIVVEGVCCSLAEKEAAMFVENEMEKKQQQQQHEKLKCT